MKNLAIVVDSSIGLTLEEQKNWEGLFVAPLSIIYNNIEYVDQVDITLEEVQDILSRNDLIKTSQPSVGVALELFEKIQKEGYEHILVLSLSSKLSGTYNSFSTAAKALDNNNVHVIDTLTLAGAVQEGIRYAQALDKAGKSIDEIVAMTNNFYNHTVSYVIPENLDQLKASGRISAAASALASLLKMRVLLRLENHGDTIEKFATARTESKIISTMISDINNSDFDPKKDKFRLLHSLAEERSLELKKHLEDLYDGIEVEISFLPAAVSGHAGNGTIAVQWFGNYKNYM